MGDLRVIIGGLVGGIGVSSVDVFLGMGWL